MYFHVYIILHITYRNDSVLCQSECACLHTTVFSIVVLFVKSNENTYPKGKALMQMYIFPKIMNHPISRKNIYCYLK